MMHPRHHTGRGWVQNGPSRGSPPSPASLSSAAITGLLRGQLGFSGLVVTDSLSAGAVAAAGYDVPHAAVAAIEAGADLILFGSTLTPAETALLSPVNVARSMQAIQAGLVAAVQSGALPVSRLDDTVGHVLAAARDRPSRLKACGADAERGGGRGVFTHAPWRRGSPEDFSAPNDFSAQKRALQGTKVRRETKTAPRLGTGESGGRPGVSR